MPTTHPSFQPNEISAPDGRHSQKVMARYKAGLTGTAQYRKFDIVKVDTADGTIAKFVDTTAANAVRLAAAHTDYVRAETGLGAPPRTPFEKVTRLEGRWVLNMAGVVPTDPAGQQRNVAFDTTDGVLKVQAGATSPAVKVIGFAGEAAPGDTNPPVVVEFLESARY